MYFLHVLKYSTAIL